MSLRMILGLGVLAAIAVSIGGWTLSERDANRLRGEVARHEACATAVGSPTGASSVAETCAKPIAQADKDARRLRACEGALKINVTRIEGDTIEASNGATVLSACSGEIAKLFSQTLTDATSIIGLRGSLAAAEQDRNQAVARAEARGRSQAERESRARALRERAPRDSDGLRVYDADRLRERWEAYP